MQGTWHGSDEGALVCTSFEGSVKTPDDLQARPVDSAPKHRRIKASRSRFSLQRSFMHGSLQCGHVEFWSEPAAVLQVLSVRHECANARGGRPLCAATAAMFLQLSVHEALTQKQTLNEAVQILVFRVLNALHDTGGFLPRYKLISFELHQPSQ